jgi:hypothetical protein
MSGTRLLSSLGLFRSKPRCYVDDQVFLTADGLQSAQFDKDVARIDIEFLGGPHGME